MLHDDATASTTTEDAGAVAYSFLSPSSVPGSMTSSGSESLSSRMIAYNCPPGGGIHSPTD